MTGIVERIGSLAGTEAAKAINLAHQTFQARMGVHNHAGRALVETVAEVCRNHPNLVGIAVGLLVEQLLVEERRKHDLQQAHQEAEAEERAAGLDPALVAEAAAEAKAEGQPSSEHEAHVPAVTPLAAHQTAHLPTHLIRHGAIRPGRIAFEVFGGLLLLKLGAAGAKMFRRRHKTEVWFAPAARIHLFSATFAAYHLAAAIKSHKISSWRNAAILLFGTDAVKPLLKAQRH